MRLPGTRYQEHGWEQVRKLLGHCSLQAFKQCQLAELADPARAAATLDWYSDTVTAALHAGAGSARAEAAGNSYGESVFELALSLVWELHAQPACWEGLVAALARDGAGNAVWADGAEGLLRKKVNDMYAGLRDKVDAGNYQAASGQACSPNKIYAYRMLDTAYREIAALFANWRAHTAQVAAILGRPLDGIPIEARQMQAIGGCRAEWVMRWSETQERFGGAPGPLHTRSKRFASLKNNPAKIAAMMAEIGDYEELSANRDSADDWQAGAGTAALWLDDYWRLMNEAEPAHADDRILPAVADPFDEDAGEEAGPEEEAQDGDEVAVPAASAAREQAAAAGVSLPLRYIELARAAQQRGSWALRLLGDDTLAIRLAVYQKLLGPADDSYPDAWRDPATGALPTMQQLAALDGISLPTLRKRRNDAIARLQAAAQ